MTAPSTAAAPTTVPPATAQAATTAAAPPADQPASPCGTRADPPATYQHVVWIVMENHSFGSVIGSPAAPFLSALARQCAAFTHWSAAGSPSLPNYLALTSGSTQGVTDDAGPAAHPIDSDNLFRQVRASGRMERSYEEDMPVPCAAQSTGTYAVKHNPAAYYTNPSDHEACLRDNVPLGSLSTGNLASDVAADTLPAFALITPNLCNDTHDCGIATGDRWLDAWIPKLVAMPSYQRGDTAIAVVYDEYTPVPNVVMSASVRPPGPAAATPVNHDALLRTTETLLGIPDHLGGAAGAVDLRPLAHL